jgi:hypothetical protein
MQWIGRQLEIKTKVIATQHGTTKALILAADSGVMDRNAMDRTTTRNKDQSNCHTTWHNKSSNPF